MFLGACQAQQLYIICACYNKAHVQVENFVMVHLPKDSTDILLHPQTTPANVTIEKCKAVGTRLCCSGHAFGVDGFG